MHDLREDVGLHGMLAECVRQGVDESVAVIERDSDLELPNKEITHALCGPAALHAAIIEAKSAWAASCGVHAAIVMST